jgi:DNA polymerase III delta prime subunit
MTETQLWYDKYRPRAFDKYVWPGGDLKESVSEWVAKRNVPSLLFAGGPGRGKTTLAQLIINELGLDSSDVLVLKGAKDNNAETIRTKVQEFCELGGWSGLRIVFFDEADLLSRTAQEMLRTVIDDYSDNVRFIFTCNYPNRIIEALSSSRLRRIDIETIPRKEFMARLIDIVVAEQVDVDQSGGQALDGIVRACYPDLRAAIDLLQWSVKDGKLRRVHGVKVSEAWQTAVRSVLLSRADPLAEVCRLRELLAGLQPDDIEDVYRFLCLHGAEFFGDKQINAIFIINAGQKVHRAALLPDLILLEVIIRLLVLLQE